MDLIGPIIEIFKCVCPPLCKYVQYHRKLDDKMNDLKRELEGLNKKKQDIEAKLSRAKLEQGKKPSNEVNHWLENVERIDNEVKSIEKEVNKRKYFARARLGKDVEEKIQEVEKYHHDGRSFTAENLVSDDPPTSGRMLPTTETLAGKKTEKIVEEIWVDLMGDKVLKIGVWGMGGIGKTTIMSHINNRLQEKPNKFDEVIWVTVSQPLDLIKLQTEIAPALKERLLATESKEGRAAMILGMLKAKGRFVLILDDMWEAFRLEEVGIPEPSEENGCKLVITTRFVGVCRSMGCKEVRVQTLSKEEALNLFLDKVGNNILEIPTLNKEIINSVVEECAGLPLAIVTVAGCMRGVDEIHEWRNALNELRGRLRSLNDVDTKVFGRLEFSYHRLKDEKLQQCFLYCALYPEDFAIPKEELIDYWIAEGFLEEVEDVQAKNDRGHTILNRLVNCCLLESAKDGSCVKMHDLIRDMALRITSKSPLFMVKAGLRLLKFPGEQEWEENLERVSLMRNNIEEIPSNMSPHCDILSTLLLERNENLQRIPECFFVHMHGLKVLNLSFTNIEVLPSSVSDLTNLRSLLLGWCRTERVPSLAKLLALQYLDLEGTRIEEVPEGMEMLENLTHLYLYSWRLKKFPTGMALRITSESPLFMVKVGLRLQEFPGEQEWKANLKRVSLMRNNIKEIPSNMSPHCEILSTLLLQRNRNLQRIPECFFVHMHGLKVLNLSRTNIEVLPSSVSDLTNLRSLLLGMCERLKRVPSLAKLLALQYLDLEVTGIEEVPEGMEMLENLSHLYLRSSLLKKFPAGILPKLRNLYKLKLRFGREALRETVEEAARLSDRLDTFEGHFSTLKDFNIYVKSTDGRGSKNYCLLLLASGVGGFLITDLEVDKSVLLYGCKICEREETIVLPKDVQCLEMLAVDDVASLNDVLPREQGLVNIGKFSHDLKVLRFNCCDNLKNLFSLRLLPALQKLEVLEVQGCDSIEEIVAVEDEETKKELATNTIITLPRLKKLNLWFMREFKSVCSDNGVLVCNSLQEIEVYHCPKLKRLSLSLPLLDNGQPSPPAALKVIEIKKELWESLEWDQANAKDVLNPYCKFVER